MVKNDNDDLRRHIVNEKKCNCISLADSNYFELLNELVDSIKSFEKSKDTAICILDAGLSEQQKIHII